MARLRITSLRFPGYLSIYELGLRWGVSETPIDTMVKKGTLTAHKLKWNYRFFKIEDIELIERTGLRPRPKSVSKRKIRNRFDPQWVTAECFRMFRDGAKRSEIVCALNISDDEVDRLYKRYKDDDLETIYARGGR